MSRSAVPRRWPGSTICCLGAGPSLCVEDLTLIRQSGHPALAVNKAAFAAPWADAIWSSDVMFFRDHPQLEWFGGKCFTLKEGDRAPYWVREIERTGQIGLELDPTGVKTGGHSGYAAVNVAFHLGASRILLLGYDMQPSPEGKHHFPGGDHASGAHPRYEQWLGHYALLYESLKTAGVDLINCSRVTAIPDVPRLPLFDALREAA